MQHKSQAESDHSILLLILGGIAVVLFTAVICYDQRLLFALWRLLYLPQAEVVAWFAKLQPWVAATKAVTLPTIIKTTPLAYYTSAFCAAASRFLGQWLNWLSVPVIGWLCYKLQRDMETTNYGQSAIRFSRWGSGTTPSKLADPLTPPAFIEQHKLQLNAAPKLRKRQSLNVLEIQLGRKFTHFAELTQQAYGWLPAALVKIKPDLDIRTSRHRYDFTVLLDLVQQVKAQGIVPAAMFAPLQSTHPILWLAINSLGRKSIPSECLALMVQYRAECRAKNALAMDVKLPLQHFVNLKQARDTLEKYVYGT